MADPWARWGDPPTIEHLALNQMKVGATVTQSMRFGVEEDVVRDQLVHHLTAMLLAQPVSQQTVRWITTVTVPDGWFQTWKAEWARDWVLKRWPVRMRQDVTYVDAIAEDFLTYPGANLALPEREWGRPVRVSRWRR